ncbi:hypothetical protein KC345_g149 [Hortaea werneckii]|nr:hypothetical protein KC345_g149 [Hortaea werneckii]
MPMIVGFLRLPSASSCLSSMAKLNTSAPRARSFTHRSAVASEGSACPFLIHRITSVCWSIGNKASASET